MNGHIFRYVNTDSPKALLFTEPSIRLISNLAKGET